MNRFYPLLSVILLAAACKQKPEAPRQQQGNQPVVVDVIIAGYQPINNTVEANGTIVANEFVELRSEVNGRLTYLNVPEGNYVQQGTVIARINDADLQAQVAKTKVLLDMAMKTEERLRKLLAINGVNQADYDIALNAVNSYKADIAYTQSLIDKTVLKAPFSGVIGLRQVSPGAFLTTATTIATIQQLDKIKVDFTLPEEYSNLIRRGEQVQVIIDATKKTIRTAVIQATEPVVNMNTRNLKVRAIMQGTNLNPGSYVKVLVSSSKDAKAIMVPTNAMLLDDKNKQLVVVKNGKGSFVNIETGIRFDGNVEVLKGIKPGDSVVVSGVLFVRPMSALKVKSVKNLGQLEN